MFRFFKNKEAKLKEQREAILKPEHNNWLMAVMSNAITGGVVDQAVSIRAAKLIEEKKLDDLVTARMRGISAERKELRKQGNRNRRKRK